MSKLEELRNTIEKMFEIAGDKQSIEQATQLKQNLEQVENEFKSLEEKNKELIKDYKEIVKNTHFTTKTADQTGTTEVKVQSVEEALKDFASDEKNKIYF